ncbi:hypothetical protein [Kordiimonas marina]|uniref:hypothetical protein n=1 Tax=Kordiimonas marina TaxID=2872312 RepID=UPI001FF4B37D|nr:hypothetical protein [Kordiimonas marina]MCJ9428577.1 hypothetical protein [Kordiimonas marina]
MMAIRDTHTLDLFDWQPPVDVAPKFDPERVKGQHLFGQLARGISEALSDCGKNRDQVVEEMRAFLGDDLAGKLSVNVLNGYASAARSEAMPNAVRLAALVLVTRDIRLLNLIAELCGWMVIEAKYLPAIHEAMLADEIDRRHHELELLEERKKRARKGWTGGQS